MLLPQAITVQHTPTNSPTTGILSGEWFSPCRDIEPYGERCGLIIDSEICFASCVSHTAHGPKFLTVMSTKSVPEVTYDSVTQKAQSAIQTQKMADEVF